VRSRANRIASCSPPRDSALSHQDPVREKKSSTHSTGPTVRQKAKLDGVTLSHEELFQRYVHAGPLTRDPDAVAELFTEDGVFEAPLLPPGHHLPQRLSGRAAIRAGMGAFHTEPSFRTKVDVSRTGYVLHETTDPDVFIVEIESAFDNGETMSLVQIFRVREGRIAHMRDYFRAP
jgi:ketosteroid isomerase-like protein